VELLTPLEIGNAESTSVRHLLYETTSRNGRKTDVYKDIVNAGISNGVDKI
jgi:hypothetical protein